MKDKKGIITTRVLEMAKDYDAPQTLINNALTTINNISDISLNYSADFVYAIVKLAEYCNVSIDYLLGRSDKYWL